MLNGREAPRMVVAAVPPILDAFNYIPTRAVTLSASDIAWDMASDYGVCNYLYCSKEQPRIAQWPLMDWKKDGGSLCLDRGGDPMQHRQMWCP